MDSVTRLPPTRAERHALPGEKHAPSLKPVNLPSAGRGKEFPIGDGEAVGCAVDEEDFEHTASGSIDSDDFVFSADVEGGAAEDHGDRVFDTLGPCVASGGLHGIANDGESVGAVDEDAADVVESCNAST